MSSTRRVFASLLTHPIHLVWIALAFIPFLGSMSVPLTGDQKLYLSQALEMRHFGIWWKPLLWGQPSYFKPPFQFWMTLLGWKVFGLGLFGALLPSVLALLATCWLLCEISLLLQQKRQFVNTGLWFAATLGALTFGTTAQMEIWVVFFYVLSWWCGLRYLADPIGLRSELWLFLAFGAAGLSALVKSPLYSAFWVIGYFLFLLISGEWELLVNKRLYQALLFGIVVGLVWFVSIWFTDHDRFVAEYLVRETWEKKYGNHGSPGSLWLALLYDFLPLTLFLLPTAQILIRGRRTSDLLRFAVAFALAPAAFFTLYPYRVKTYLFILLPLLAVLADWAYFRSGRSRRFRWIVIVTGLLLFATFAFMGLLVDRSGILPLWIGTVFFALSVLVILASVYQNMRGVFLVCLAGILMVRAAAVSLGEADIQGLRNAIAARSGSRVGLMDENRNIWNERGLLGAALGFEVRRFDTWDEAADFLQAGGLLALSDEQWESSERMLQAKLLGRSEKRELDSIPWRRWKRRLHFPFKKLILESESVPSSELRAQLEREFRIYYLAP